MPRSRFKQRRRRRNRPRPSVLILCEGRRTEPNYFKALSQDLGLTACEVQAGIERRTVAREVRAALHDFDRIWYVVDEDDQPREIAALRQQFRDLHRRRNQSVEAAVSSPCFEFWLLLHFEFTTAPFRGTPGGRSACEQVIQRLERHLPDYRKNDPSIYRHCRHRVSQALKNASRLEAEQGGPSTDVHSLVRELQKLSREQNPPSS